MAAAYRVHDHHGIQGDERGGERCTLGPDLPRRECDETCGGRDRGPREHLECEDRAIRRTCPRAGEPSACQREQRTVVRACVKPLHGGNRDEAIVRKRRQRREVGVAAVQRLDAPVGRIRVDVPREEQRSCDGDEQAARRCDQHSAKADPLRPCLQDHDCKRGNHDDEECPRDARQSAASHIVEVRRVCQSVRPGRRSRAVRQQNRKR